MRLKNVFPIFFVCSVVIVLFLSGVNAGSFDFNADDELGDVSNSDVDIVSASIREDGDNFIFTLEVLGSIVTSDEDYRYIFEINSGENVWFYNDLSFVFEPSSVICSHVVDGNTVTITVPKSALEEVTVPWSVNATALIYSKSIKDSAVMELYKPKSSTDNSSPGFELIIVISALLLFILAHKRAFN